MRPFTTVSNFVRQGFSGRAKSSAVLLGLTIVLASCGGNSGGGGGGGTPAPTATLTATPSAIFPGQAVTLTFTSTNANQGSIDMGEGPVGANGGVTANPTVTTTYTFTATGPGGTATATVTVTVNQITSFDGLRQSDGVTDQDVDPNGAIGTKQYMEYVNTAIQAYDKGTGAPVWPAAKQIETLWPSGPCAVNQTTGKPAIQLDVVIIFDRLASRWVVGAKTSNPNQSVGYFFCIAVSSTDDLSSSSLTWNSYSSIKLDPILKGNGTHTYFPDWPKLSTWTDATGQQSAYYATMDLQDIDNGNAEVGAVVCAFDRTGILNNPGNIKSDSCVDVSHQNDSVLWSNGLFLGHSLIPADVDGTSVPPAGRDEFMVSIENPLNDGVTLTSSALNLWEFHVDWTAATPLTVTSQSPISVPVADYIPGCYLSVPGNPAITNCVQEPPTPANPQQPQIIDSVGDRLMPRLAYRNFGSHESYLVTHAIQTGNNSQNATQTGVRWYEFRDNGSGTPSLNQSGTINPDDILYRFLPSIAQDKKGNVAVGYSTSNRFTNPGIYFSYWSLPNATAPAEILITQGDGEEVTNTAPFAGKWGTYSSMTVDPIDDCTFWYVNEYFAADNTWLTRIANFKVPGCQ